MLLLAMSALLLVLLALLAECLQLLGWFDLVQPQHYEGPCLALQFLLPCCC